MVMTGTLAGISLLAPDLTKDARARVSDVVRTSSPEVAARRGHDLLDRILAGTRSSPVTHVEDVPARPGRPADWPDWAPDLLVDRLAARGIARPWEHQAAAASLAWSGRSVVVATGTASGKSLAYQLPVLSTLLTDEKATALYLAPTKALAARPAALAPLAGPVERPGRVLRRRHGAARSGTGSGRTPGSC